jgi:hypothetical protein
MQRTNHSQPNDYGLVTTFTTYKMIDLLTKQISKHESHDNNNKEVKRSKEEEQQLGRENLRDYIRRNDGRIHYIDDY